MKLIVSQVEHELTEDGQEVHYFKKVGGIWVCACGERRDRFKKIE